MSAQESQPILPNSPEILHSFEAQYPGIFDLRVLPEVQHMHATPYPDGSFDLTVVSADGYTLLYKLRKPNEQDFNGDIQSRKDAVTDNYLTIEGMKLTHRKGTIDILTTLRQAEERIANGHKNTYLIAASKPKHLHKIPGQYLGRENYSPDAIDEEPVTADIIRNSIYMDEAGFNERANSLHLRLPVGDISLYTFLHEAAHSLDMHSQNNTLEPYGTHPRLKPIYESIHETDRQIKKNKVEYSEFDKLVQKIEIENPNDPNRDDMYNQLFDIHDAGIDLSNIYLNLFKLADREQHILSERNAHVPTLRAAESAQRNLGFSRNRLKRMRMFERFVLYSYQKNLEKKREKYPLPNLDSRNLVYIPEKNVPFYEDIVQKVKDFTANSS